MGLLSDTGQPAFLEGKPRINNTCQLPVTKSFTSDLQVLEDSSVQRPIQNTIYFSMCSRTHHCVWHSPLQKDSHKFWCWSVWSEVNLTSK